jgi:hypothetical protein
MINRHIDEMSHGAENVLCGKLKNNSFSIQVDEPTDFTNKSYFAAFVRFVYGGESQENFFFCKELSETSKGQDIFNVSSSCLKTNSRSWENCVGICTDDAPSVAGSIRCFASLVKKRKNPKVTTTYSFIYREVLVSKTVRDEIKFCMTLQKWLTLSNKDQFTPDCFKKVRNPGQTVHKSPTTYRNPVA